MTDPSLLARCRDPGFTPGARDVAALVELWRAVAGTPHDAKAVVSALARGEGGVARKLERGLGDADGPERAMRLRVLARISRRMELPTLPDVLEAALEDPEPRVVREAVRAIGKLDEAAGSLHEDTLLRVAREAALPERRAAVEALGRVGGELALAYLTRFETDDPELARRTARAVTLLERRAHRERAGSIDPSRPLPAPRRVRLRCRGAAPLVAEEAASVLPGELVSGIEVRDPHTVTLWWSGSFGDLLAVRTAVDAGLVFPLPAGPDLAERILDGLAAPELLQALAAWTDGAIRFRLSFVGGGARRSVVWAVARELGRRGSPLRNDSRGVSWTVEVDEARDRLICTPRGADTRFAYRQADVPAASHPTLAALMARVAAPSAGDLVWDPHCGCGAELIECARLAPDLRLLGTDTDPQAIAAARTNAAAAGLGKALRLEPVDAIAGSPAAGTVAAIVTNPPMGRRASTSEGVHDSLCAFVRHAATVLRPGGRLVWVTPAARVTAEAGASAGLTVHDHGPIDMSGFRVVLQVMERA